RFRSSRTHPQNGGGRACRATLRGYLIRGVLEPEEPEESGGTGTPAETAFASLGLDSTLPLTPSACDGFGEAFSCLGQHSRRLSAGCLASQRPRRLSCSSVRAAMSLTHAERA